MVTPGNPAGIIEYATKPASHAAAEGEGSCVRCIANLRAHGGDERRSSADGA